jgi:hypothetical protein
MKDQSSPKPKPTTQHEVLQYQAKAEGAAEVAKAAKQRLRKAKAAVKAAREAHRQAKRLAADARANAKAARKHFKKHPAKELEPVASAKNRSRKKPASRKVTKLPPVATGPAPLGPGE